MYAPRRIPVKTVEPCPKEKINALVADIYKTTVKLPVKAGDTVIADWQGSGINVVAVRQLD
jgi:CxxC motif-containing protein